ncbi:retrovirus-related pol polyprotein from transposon TNT 1-94, partial [Tanacetum coccineum]
EVILGLPTQIVNLLSGFQKRFPPTNNQLRTSTIPKTQATIQAGHITTENVQRRAPRHVARECKEKKRAKDLQWFKDKALLMEAKEKGAMLDAEAKAFLADVECTTPYSKPLAITTTTTFEVSHEDAYDSDIDEVPHAAAAFMVNLMQIGPSTGQGTGNDTDFYSEVHTYDNHFFDNMNLQVSQDIYEREKLESDVDSVIDDHDNTIPYHQYQLNNKVESVPTDVSSVIPGEISVITILDDLRSQLEGHIKTNKEQSFANDSLKAELERYKTQVQNLEQSKVKKDLEQLVFERNKRNADLEEQLVSLKQQLLQHVESNKSLKTESEKLKADKNALEESYLEELVWLRNTNKVVTELLQSYGQPVQTVPMLSKRPTFSTKDLHKSALGHRNPLYLKSAQLCRPTLYLGDVIVDPLSREQVYWLPANEVASYNCNQFKPVTNFVRTRPAKSIEDNLFKEVSEYMKIFDELDKEYDQCVIDKKSLEIENKNLLIQNECLLAESVSKDICSVVLTSDIVVPMSVEPRSNCVKEHSRNLELEAEILKVKQLLVEKEKRCSFIETKYQELELKFQKYKECFENPQVCNNSSSPELNVFFEINKLKDQLQGKDELIRKLKAQIGNMKEVSADPNLSTLEFQALETENTQLKEELTAVRIKNDSLRDENVSIKKRYQDLYKSKVESNSNVSSRATVLEKPKVLAPSLYAMMPKYIPPQKRNNREANTPLPKKETVSLVKQTNVSENMKRVDNPLRNLNKKNRVDSSLSVKHTGFISKSVSVCKTYTGKIFASVGSKWSPTGRKFTLGDTCPLTRITKPEVVTLEKSRSVSTSEPANNVIVTPRYDGSISSLLALKSLFNEVMVMASSSKKSSHPLKTVNTNTEVLNTLHIDLCGPMRVESINRKKYILVIVDDYTRFSWVRFLRTKDETPEVIKKFIILTQRALNATVHFLRTDNGTEFVNKTLTEFCESVGITHNTSIPRTPQQNSVVKRRNRTLMEAARTMLILAKSLMFLWAEAVATACYTLNQSLVHTLHGKTYYELLKGKKPDVKYFRVFGSLCYPTNDYDDLGKLKAKADIGIFVGYAPTKKAYRIYNKRTHKIQDTVHVTFDELTEGMTSVQPSTGLRPNSMAPGHNGVGPKINKLQSGRIGSGLVTTLTTPNVPPTEKQLFELVQPLFDEDEEFPPDVHPHLVNVAPLCAPEIVHDSPSTTTVTEDAPAATTITSPSQTSPPDTGIDRPKHTFTTSGSESFENSVINEFDSEASSSGTVNVNPTQQNNPPIVHGQKWTKDHPLENVIGDLNRLVSTRCQLETDAMWCFFNEFLENVKPKNFKEAVQYPCWIDAMQEEIHEFECLAVWELMPAPSHSLVIGLKWVYKIKLDEYGEVLKNKAWLVAKGYRQEAGIDFEESFAPVVTPPNWVAAE